jgi:hypothetical protein
MLITYLSTTRCSICTRSGARVCMCMTTQCLGRLDVGLLGRRTRFNPMWDSRCSIRHWTTFFQSFFDTPLLIAASSLLHIHPSPWGVRRPNPTAHLHSSDPSPHYPQSSRWRFHLCPETSFVYAYIYIKWETTFEYIRYLPIWVYYAALIPL